MDNTSLSFIQITDNLYDISLHIGSMHYNEKDCKWILSIKQPDIHLEGQYRNDLMEEAEILFNKKESHA